MLARAALNLFVGGWALLVADALPAGFFALAAALGALFVGASIASWTLIQGIPAVASYEDEEAEEE